MKRFLAVFVLALTLAGCVTETARLYGSAKHQQNYSEVYPKLLALAERGDAEAQWVVGLYLHKGLGVSSDKIAACGWFTKSANGGNHGGMNWLADCYVQGIGRPKNPSQAMYWYEKSAAQGNWGSIITIGDAYQVGYYYPKSIEKAVKYYINALARGDERALERLETLAKSDPIAQRELGGLYFYGKSVTTDYRRARDLFNRCARQLDGVCYFFLGKIYQAGGYGIEQDAGKAKAAFRKGAQYGSQQARAELDSIYSAERFTENLGQALLIGLLVFGAAAAAKSGAYYSSAPPDVSAILNRPTAAEIRHIKHGFQMRDINGNFVNSRDSYRTRDVHGNIVNSRDNYTTRDRFGNLVNSRDNFPTVDYFGNRVDSQD